MLPLLFLIVPPSVVGGSYLAWYSGQKVVLSRTKLLEPPPQSAASYFCGVSTLVVTYGLLSAVFLHHADKSTVIKEKKGYVPPKNIGEVFQRVGRPVLMRVGAGAVAFFCAGAAQTFVALRSSNNKKE